MATLAGFTVSMLTVLAAPLRPEVQLSIATGDEETLQTTLTHNPFLTPDAALVLAGSSSVYVRSFVATNCRDRLVEDVLAEDTVDDVLWELAVSTQRPSLMDRLSVHSNQYAVLGLTANPRISLGLAKHLSVVVGSRPSSLGANRSVVEGIDMDLGWGAAFLQEVFPDIFEMHLQGRSEAVRSLAENWKGTVGELLEAALLVER